MVLKYIGIIACCSAVVVAMIVRFCDCVIGLFVCVCVDIREKMCACIGVRGKKCVFIGVRERMCVYWG